VGRRRVALLLAPRDLGDPVAGALEIGAHLGGVLAVGDLELLALAARGEPREEAGVLSLASPTLTFQYSSGTKASISRSRSTMSRSATDCTRPAESPNASFDQTSAETS